MTFDVRIAADHATASVQWYGIDTSKSTLMKVRRYSEPQETDHGRIDGELVLHKAGSSYWSGIGMQSYAEAEFRVYKFRSLGMKSNTVEEFLLDGLFGYLSFPTQPGKARELAKLEAEG